MQRIAWSLMAFWTLVGMVAPAQAAPPFQGGTGIAARVAAIEKSVPAWQDDFETLIQPGFWSEETGDNSERFFEDGTYNIAVYEVDTVAWTLADDLAYEDFLLAVNTALAAGSTDNEFGIVFRYQDEDNFYVYSISSDGYYSLARLTKGKWETLIRWRRSSDIDITRGAWNDLELLVEQGSFSLLVNGQLLTTYKDSDSYVGEVGLLVGARDADGAQIAFDDFAAWDLQHLFVLKSAPTVTPTRPAPKTTPDPKETLTRELDEIRANKPLRHDDFRSNATVWPADRSEKSASFVQGGQLHLQVADTETMSWRAPDDEETVGDFYLEVEAAHVAGPLDNEIGVVFRRVDDSFYYFKISSDGYYALSRYRSGQWEPLIKWTRSAAVKTGEGSRNLLGVLANGPSLTVLVNDIVQATVSDSSLAEGTFALAAGSYEEGGIEAAFDDLYIWQLGGSRPTPTATSPAKLPSSVEPTPAPTAALRATATPTAQARAVTTRTALTSPTAAPITVTKPISTPTATPLPDARKLLGNLREAPPTFSDEFRRNDSGWDVTATGQYTITYADRQLLFQITRPNSLVWSMNPTVNKLAPVNFLLEVDAQLLEGPTTQGFGMVFGYLDPDNYHRFFVTQGGDFALQKVAQGQASALVPWTRTPALDTAPQSINRLGLLVRGEQIILMANDQVLAQTDDPTLTPGKVGLMASSSDTSGLEAAFDNVDLWQLEGIASATGTPTPTVRP